MSLAGKLLESGMCCFDCRRLRAGERVDKGNAGLV